jgi:hypothetical protein
MFTQSILIIIGIAVIVLLYFVGSANLIPLQHSGNLVYIKRSREMVERRSHQVTANRIRTFQIKE